MIVCHCKAVSDRDIRQAVREGACSYRAVALQCNAGRDCGGCRPAVLEVIEEETAERADAPRASSRLAAAS